MSKLDLRSPVAVAALLVTCGACGDARESAVSLRVTTAMTLLTDAGEPVEFAVLASNPTDRAVALFAFRSCCELGSIACGSEVLRPSDRIRIEPGGERRLSVSCRAPDGEADYCVRCVTTEPGRPELRACIRVVGVRLVLVDPARVSLGELALGATARFEARVASARGQPLNIADIAGLASVRWERLGDDAFQLRGDVRAEHPGRLALELEITTNLGKARVIVDGEVLDPVCVEPACIVLGDGARAARNLRCTTAVPGARIEAVELEDVGAFGPFLEASVTGPLSASVTLLPGAPAGLVRGQLELTFDRGVPPRRVPLVGVIGSR